MSLRTWLIKLLGGEPRLSSPTPTPAPTDRRAGDRVVTNTANVSKATDVSLNDEEEEEIGSLSLTTEMDELLYLTADSVTNFDLSGKGVSIIYSNNKLKVTDTLGSTIFIGASGPGQTLLELPLGGDGTYDIFFNQASATLIIAGKPATEKDDDCKLYLFPIDDRRVSISRNKQTLVVRES